MCTSNNASVSDYSMFSADYTMQEGMDRIKRKIPEVARAEK
jgi:hypothetical protein